MAPSRWKTTLTKEPDNPERCWLCNRTKQDLVKDMPDDFWEDGDTFFLYFPIGGLKNLAKGSWRRQTITVNLRLCKVCWAIRYHFRTP